MSEKDPNYTVKVEKAIAKKYGEETIQHPKSNWTDEKEKEYLVGYWWFHSWYGCGNRYHVCD